MSDRAIELITTAHPESVIKQKDVHGILHVTVRPDVLHPIVQKLLNASPPFDYLLDIMAVDLQDSIEAVYQFTCLSTNEKIGIRVELDRESPEVKSITDLYPGAELMEREAYDLMGIIFTDHPDLRRILLPVDWEGYPLRKDYVIED